MINKIAGTDEVGRGALAGPIVAATFSISFSKLISLKYSISKALQQKAILSIQKDLEHLFLLINHDLSFIPASNKGWSQMGPTQIETRSIHRNTSLAKLKDSKKLSHRHRESMLSHLFDLGNFGLGVISNNYINKKGLQKANMKCMKKSMKIHLKNTNTLFLTDHFVPKNISANITGITKGDNKSFVIAAASIIAKEYRDAIMKEYSKIFPKYEFEKHVGYGTKKHLELTKKYGPCKIHRTGYKIFK